MDDENFRRKSLSYKIVTGSRQDLVKPIIVKKNKINQIQVPQQELRSVILPSSSWQGGARGSAFQPYKPSTTPVLTNLQRGNTEASVNAESLDPAEPGWHMAAGMGDLTAAQITLAVSDRNIDAKDEGGMTALIWAATFGQLPTIERLVGAGANVNNICSKGYSALLLAAYNGHYEVVRYLLAVGADVNHYEEKGNTALMYAAYGNHPHVANELLIRGASILPENSRRDTAYSIAVKRKSKAELFCAVLFLENFNVPMGDRDLENLQVCRKSTIVEMLEAGS